MAGTPPIVANTDFSQWQNWQQVKTPDGSSTYYQIPGYNGQYVFDPFTSDATGQITIYENPKPAYDAAAKLQAQQDAATGNSAQLAQIGGTLAGAGTTYLVADAVKNPASESILGGLFGGGGTTAATEGGKTAAQVVTGSGGATPEILSATRVPASSEAATGAFGASLVPVLGAAGGAALVAKGAKDLYNGKSGTGSLEGLGGRGQLAITTGGLSEVARLAGIGGKSTKDYQAQRRGELADRGDVGSANFLAESRKTANSNNDTWQDGKYKGQKWSFEKAKDLATEDPTHLIGVYGNFQAVGDKWLSTPEDKQKEFVSRALAEDLYSSDKGNVLFSGKNLDRAKQLYEEVMTAGTKKPEDAQQIESNLLGAATPNQRIALPGGNADSFTKEQLTEMLLKMQENEVLKGVGKQPTVFS